MRFVCGSVAVLACGRGDVGGVGVGVFVWGVGVWGVWVRERAWAYACVWVSVF